MANGGGRNVKFVDRRMKREERAMKLREKKYGKKFAVQRRK